jgi:hypothetical protein
MFDFLPTQCLRWLAQIVSEFDGREFLADMSELEEGLSHWADSLIPQLQTLETGDWSQYPSAAESLENYCVSCLGLCEDIMECSEEGKVDPIRVADWKEVLWYAVSAFRDAEEALDGSLGEALC